MGLGLHDGGLGVTKFLVEQGAKVTVTDLRSPEVLAPTLAKLEGLPVALVLGEHREEDFRDADIVIRNPAVPATSRFLQIAREAGAHIEMELSLFYQLCPSRLVFGITGTRGKTTTTTLLGAILKEWRSETVVAGNLRVSALNKLSEIGSDTPVALEISSFQLEGFGESKLSPPFAAVTNLSPDHLNRYWDMQEYAEAKRWIYRNQGTDGVVILNRQDELVSTFAKDAPGQVIWFDDKPLKEGFAGAYLQDERLVWRDWQGHEEEIGPRALLKIPGRHNLLNALCAIALAKTAGVPLEAIRRGLENFKGVSDRLELVREINGVRFINDTTSTSPAGAVAALEALRESEKRDILLIAGGADKNLDFTPMAHAIGNPDNRVAGIVLLEGTATNRLREAILAEGFPAQKIIGVFGDFEAAIKEAQLKAHSGMIILLSPGCASFGLFTHEFERGQRFRDIVNNLKVL
jgi:UDP-N-acetylmuramoylalanine--D-glutamate ligase